MTEEFTDVQSDAPEVSDAALDSASETEEQSEQEERRSLFAPFRKQYTSLVDAELKLNPKCTDPKILYGRLIDTAEKLFVDKFAVSPEEAIMTAYAMMGLEEKPKAGDNTKKIEEFLAFMLNKLKSLYARQIGSDKSSEARYDDLCKRLERNETLLMKATTCYVIGAVIGIIACRMYYAK